MKKILKIISMIFSFSAVGQNKTIELERLKKRITLGKNILIPEMLKKESTTYEISNAYDLDERILIGQSPI
jgi:hypothetical protein